MTNQSVDIRPTDVLFMPELQLRGVQVGADHPYVGELRKLGVKTYAVIHDILPLRMPQYFESATGKQFDAYVREIVDNYDGILTVSQFVSEDVMQYCHENHIKGNHKVKIGFFHNGHDFVKSNKELLDFELQTFFNTSQKVYLMVGTIEPRKGHEIIFNAFKKMWQEGFNGKLCIIGHSGWNMEGFIKKMREDTEFGNRLQYFDHASDADVSYAYQHAACLIQASAGEGFGLPLIEASDYQIPVLCSDIPVFHEVGQDAVNYFDRNNQDSIIDCIRKFEKGDNVKDSSLIKKSSWKESAGKIFKMIINDNGWIGEL